MIKTYKMKKLIVFMFSVVLLGSCGKCFECEFENRIDSTVCSTDFDSKQDMLELAILRYIHTICSKLNPYSLRRNSMVHWIEVFVWMSC